MQASQEIKQKIIQMLSTNEQQIEQINKNLDSFLFKISREFEAVIAGLTNMKKAFVKEV